jgi:rhodanese-related sulfurtransferase
MESPEPAPIEGSITMRRLLELRPGAQRALFARYHIGGCRSCAFQPDETLEELCARNGGLPVNQVLEHIERSHQRDLEQQCDPLALHRILRDQPDAVRLLDLRTREEFEDVPLPGARLFTRDLLQVILQTWPRDVAIVVFDHTGSSSSLDAAAYLEGQGFINCRSLRGGIDAYSCEADPAIPRYRLELDEQPAHA